MAICRLDDISKGYGTGNTHVWALRHVSFTIEAGEFTVLAGPSGSGKTTALNLIGCLDTPTEGEVHIEGRATSGLRGPQLAALRADRIGFVFQSFNLIPVLSALENVELALQLAGRKDANRDRARQALTDVGLGDLLHRRPNQLSGGQQQRLCIARAIAVQPEVILMDEPCSALDPIATAKVEALIEELKGNYAIAIVTHSMQQAARISQKTAFFHLGELVELGDTTQIFTAPKEERTRDYITGRFG